MAVRAAGLFRQRYSWARAPESAHFWGGRPPIGLTSAGRQFRLMAAPFRLPSGVEWNL